MDRKLPELKAEAKRVGLKRYSRLKKAELINLIARNSSPILDEEIPEIDSEILKPTKYITAPFNNIRTQNFNPN